VTAGLHRAAQSHVGRYGGDTRTFEVFDLHASEGCKVSEITYERT
jgi:hypothetical protein